MKNFKKIFAALLALTLVLALGITAFADDEKDGSTIELPENGHTYKIYQIFTGDVVEGKLTGIKWGTDGKGAPGTGVDAETLEALTTLNGTAAANGIAIKAYVTGDGKQYTGEGQVIDVVPGYYLIQDVAISTTNFDDIVSLYVVKVCNDVVFEPKGDKPEVQKKVKDINDSTDTTTTEWQDSADYDIDDDVPFQLTATMPSSFDGYETYKVIFHDTLSAGLKYNDNAVVKIGDKVITEKFAISESNGVLTISCDNVLAEEVGAEANNKIVVEYTAKLTGESVNFGSEGNPNEVYLEYSNNPYTETETGETPVDKVIVFTYKVVVNKTDEANNPLKGAGFTLYKKNASITVTDENDGYEVIGEEVKGTDMTTFTWEGLDDGEYKLVETTVPANYNKMKDQFFTVTAEHDADADDPKLTVLSAAAAEGSEIAFTAGNKDGKLDGSLTTTIVNQSGAVLPETGGIGTTIFYVIGAILLVGAGVLLITKKRMGVEG